MSNEVTVRKEIYLTLCEIGCSDAVALECAVRCDVHLPTPIGVHGSVYQQVYRIISDLNEITGNDPAHYERWMDKSIVAMFDRVIITK